MPCQHFILYFSEQPTTEPPFLTLKAFPTRCASRYSSFETGSSYGACTLPTGSFRPALTVVRDGHRLVSKIGAVLHQHAHKEAVHVHVKYHSGCTPTQPPHAENRLRGPWYSSCCKPGVYYFYRVGTAVGKQRVRRRVRARSGGVRGDLLRLPE